MAGRADDREDGATGGAARARLGAAGEMLRRLSAARAPTGPVTVLDADFCAAWGRDAAADKKRLAEVMAGREPGAYSLAVAPVSEAALAPPEARDVAAGDLPERIDAILTQWRSEKSARRRRALGACHACALIVRPETADPAARALAGPAWRALHDPATGAELTGSAEAGLDVAVRAALTAAEDALGVPLECRLEASSGPDGVAIRAARHLAARPQAAVAIAVRMADQGRITRSQALMALRPHALEEMLHASLDEAASPDPIAVGYPASPGAVAGRLCFTAAQAEALARAEEPAIIVRAETKPEDVHGMKAAVGVLTTRGGLTSHAAVVARGLGLPCVVGAGGLRLDEDEGGALGAERGSLRAADGRVFRAGDWVTLDGAAGLAHFGRLPTRPPSVTGAFQTLMSWADDTRRLDVRANADTPQDVRTALNLGVDGVGLCRTEHMFFEPARIAVMREMILADAPEDRRKALAKLLPMQRADFEQIFEIVDALSVDRAPPVTIRLFDPPLHEFLPQSERGLEMLAGAMSVDAAKLKKRAQDLAEVNPMLGKRGCRVGVAFPEIYETQARAIVEAALDVAERCDRAPRPEIMVPLVSAARELEEISSRVQAVVAEICAARGRRIEIGVGIMVETPRAALRAGQLAEMSTFFSFGTNDLTQMTYGLSRDDAGRLMRDYVERGVFEADPFQSLDREGVGELIQIAVERGREANPGLELGLCGEHGADPATIDFCEQADFDYVSCSPFRAPIARLAAAQAAIRRRGGG